MCTILPNNTDTNSSRTDLAVIVNLIYQVEKHAQISRHVLTQVRYNSVYEVGNYTLKQESD